MESVTSDKGRQPVVEGKPAWQVLRCDENFSCACVTGVVNTFNCFGDANETAAVEQTRVAKLPHARLLLSTY